MAARVRELESLSEALIDEDPEVDAFDMEAAIAELDAEQLDGILMFA